MALLLTSYRFVFHSHSLPLEEVKSFVAVSLLQREPETLYDPETKKNFNNMQPISFQRKTLQMHMK